MTGRLGKADAGHDARRSRRQTSRRPAAANRTSRLRLPPPCPANFEPDDFNYSDEKQNIEAREVFSASRQDSTISGASVGDINPIYPREGQNFQELQSAASRRIPPSGSSDFVRLEQPASTYRPVRTGGPGSSSPCRALPLQCNDGLAPAGSKS